MVQDEREGEGGERALLNLGHTFGHALEAASGFSSSSGYLHGEAVSVGLAMAATLSWRLGWIQEEDKDRIVRLLQLAQLPVTLLPQAGRALPEELLQFMAADKKAVNGRLTLVLPRGSLGNAVVTRDVPLTLVSEVLAQFCSPKRPF